MTLPRGYRNNNPGNLRKGGALFIGEKPTSTDTDFRQFTTIEYGYRAIFKLLDSYQKMGVDTIEKIINRYAPTNENNTLAYITKVAKDAGIEKTAKLDYTNRALLTKVVASIAQHENGIAPVMAQITSGYDLFIGNEKKK